MLMPAAACAPSRPAMPRPPRKKPACPDAPRPNPKSVRGNLITVMMDKFTIGVVQMRSTKNAAENLDRAVEKIREAAARGAQIISLDELFLSEYFCRTEDAALFDLAQPI